jgi:hypothetical protein
MPTPSATPATAATMHTRGMLTDFRPGFSSAWASAAAG